jgi:hypothetical protein
MQLQKYSDMGAIDAVFKQFVPGRKDDSTYQTPKLGSSLDHQPGRPSQGICGRTLTVPLRWVVSNIRWCTVFTTSLHPLRPRKCAGREAEDGAARRW